jgi:hypothetical protein
MSTAEEESKLLHFELSPFLSGFFAASFGRRLLLGGSCWNYSSMDFESILDFL